MGFSISKGDLIQILVELFFEVNDKTCDPYKRTVVIFKIFCLLGLVLLCLGPVFFLTVGFVGMLKFFGVCILAFIAISGIILIFGEKDMSNFN